MDYAAAKVFILNKLRRELSPKLTYHGLHHTLDVLRITIELCKLENIEGEDLTLLKTAALYHDCGFTIDNKEHEKIGCKIARDTLPGFHYTEEQIDRICSMIMATKIPQSPKNKMEQILCDADLDYLGRDDFYTIANSLFIELKNFQILQDIESWNRIQVSFLDNHQFFTPTNRGRRRPQKTKYLDELKTIVENYEKK